MYGAMPTMSAYKNGTLYKGVWSAVSSASSLEANLKASLA